MCPAKLDMVVYAGSKTVEMKLSQVLWFQINNIVHYRSGAVINGTKHYCRGRKLDSSLNDQIVAILIGSHV